MDKDRRTGKMQIEDDSYDNIHSRLTEAMQQALTKSDEDIYEHDPPDLSFMDTDSNSVEEIQKPRRRLSIGDLPKLRQ